jgi:DNA-binding transcriptional ArsR family regulator
MDVAGDPFAGGADLVESNQGFGGAHAASMADPARATGRPPPNPSARHRARTPAGHRAEHLPASGSNTCVLAQSVTSLGQMLETSVPSSSEFDRQRYAAVGRALADPKRLCVLESLAAGELSVGDLSTKVGCQVPNMSQHLAVLRSAGLVQSRRDGSTVFYRLADVRVLEAYRLIQSLAGQGA